GRHVRPLSAGRVSRLRPDAARRGPDRRSGEGPQPPGGGGAREGHRRAARGEAPDRARGGRRRGRVPARRGREGVHRRPGDDGHGLDRALSLRAIFDEDPERYDRARPGYPPELFDDLEALAGLAPGARVLEIGPGTGQATLTLTRRVSEILRL